MTGKKSQKQRADSGKDIRPILDEAKRRSEQNTVEYIEGETKVRLRYDSSDQVFWATAQDIADIFETHISNIRKHVQNIYQDEELQESRTSAKIALVQNESGREVIREVLHYNLDVTIMNTSYSFFENPQPVPSTCRSDDPARR